MRINYAKNNDNLETAFNLKSIVKVARNEETDCVHNFTLKSSTGEINKVSQNSGKCSY